MTENAFSSGESMGRASNCRAGLRNTSQFIFSAINISAHLSARRGNVSLKHTEIFRQKELHLEAFVRLV